ncbi:MAG: Nif3-like dinuclear metal center hexameric protein [Succinivibrio sp.]
MDVIELVKFLDDYLSSKSFRDPSLNGLQIEGQRECHKIATACTASLDSIKRAVEIGADTLIVHHGLFWKGQLVPVTGPMKERVASVIKADLNLIAYHLPLDANLMIGNSRTLCDILSLNDIDYIVKGDPSSVAMTGYCSENTTVKDIGDTLSKKLKAKVTVLGNVSEDMVINSVAVCSGSGSFLIDENMTPDFDALVTGDVKEQTYHFARENNIPVFVTGHHASEQDGIRRLGELVAKRFSLSHEHLHSDIEKEVLTYG